MTINLGPATLPASFATDRLLIKKHTLGDAEHLFAAARESIPEVYPFLPWCHPDYSLKDSQQWLKQCGTDWQSSSMHAFGIWRASDEHFLGGCGLNRIDDNPIANLGYWIRSSEIAKGYGTEATKGLIQYAFKQLGLYRIEIIMSVKNTASIRVAEKAGGVQEGLLKNRLYLHGQLHDSYLYGITPKPIPGL